MFCHDETTYLEVSLPSKNITDLLNSSTFCQISLGFVKYASLPAGLIIILLTTSAFIALRSRFKTSNNGTGVVFLAVIVLDFLNGFLCFRFFEQLGFRKVISFDGNLADKILEWFTWLILYTSWILKFFLCTYQLHRFLKGNIRVSWYPARPNFTRAAPLSKTTGYIIVIVSVLWSLTQLIVMYFLRNSSAASVPFLGIQTLILFACSWLIAALYFFTRYDPSASSLERFVTSTIGLNCVFTLLADGFLTYGDLSCLFHYPTPNYMTPMCYCVLARFLSYSDSIFFSAAQFRSKSVRWYFREAVKWRRNGEGILGEERYSEEERRALLVSGNLDRYPVCKEAENKTNFREVNIND